MRWFGLAVWAAILFATSLASAAPVSDVLGACDKLAKQGQCSYTINDKNGDISGCTKSSSCFYCPNDGKRQCFQVRQGDTRPVPGPDRLLNTLVEQPRSRR